VLGKARKSRVDFARCACAQDQQLDVKSAGGRFCFPDVAIIGGGRVGQKRECRNRGKHFVQKLNTLGSHCFREGANARNVTAWPVESCDQAKLDGIRAELKYNRDCSR
jgi:hypothetical protein